MMKPFPFYHQPDSMDCGPACLKMIAEFYGKKVSISFLRQSMFTTKDGVSLMSISLTAEKIGFKTIGGRLDLTKLINKANLPCILHWNQEHFVILYKIKKQNKKIFFYIADPGKGVIKYNVEEFLSHWISTKTNEEEKGIILLLEPTQELYKLAKERETDKENCKLKLLSSYFKRYKRFFGQLIIGLLAGSLLQLIFPFLTQAIVDIGIGSKNINFIWLILLAQLFLILGRTSIDFIRLRIQLHISTRINISLISDFFIKLMKLPMIFFDTKLLGDLPQRIEDHNRIERFLTAQS